MTKEDKVWFTAHTKSFNKSIYYQLAPPLLKEVIAKRRNSSPGLVDATIPFNLVEIPQRSKSFQQIVHTDDLLLLRPHQYPEFSSPQGFEANQPPDLEICRIQKKDEEELMEEEEALGTQFKAYLCPNPASSTNMSSRK